VCGSILRDVACNRPEPFIYGRISFPQRESIVKYLMTYEVEQGALSFFIKVAEPHGILHRCLPETHDFVVSQAERAEKANVQ
jgi:hypothetical protein